MESKHLRYGFWALVTVDLLFVAGHLTYNALGKWPSAAFVFVDLDAESAVPAWWSSVQLLMVAQLWAVATWFAWQRVDREGARGGAGERRAGWWVRWSLPALGLMFLVLSADESASLHERMGHYVDAALIDGGDRKATMLSTTGFWMILLAPLTLAVVLPPLIQVGRVAGWRWMGLLLAGLGVFIGSAAGLEVLSNFVPEGRRGFWPTVQVASEEGGEMIGVALLIWGAAGVALALSHPATAATTATTAATIAPARRIGKLVYAPAA